MRNGRNDVRGDGHGMKPTLDQYRRAGWRGGAVAAVALLSLAPSSSGHAVFMTYINHRATITVGPRDIDVELELTFYEVRSMAERRRMDADHDGLITRNEVCAYLKRISADLDAGLRLTIGGRAVDLVPLYDPELDLLGVNEIAPCHHVLRLFYFARTPSWLKAGDEIVLDDFLWSQTAALRSFSVTGRGEYRLAASADANAATGGSGPRGPLVMKARCLAASTTAEATAPVERGDPAPPARGRLAGILVGLTALTAGMAGGVRLYSLRREKQKTGELSCAEH